MLFGRNVSITQSPFVFAYHTFFNLLILIYFNYQVKPEAPSLTIDVENIQEYQTVKLTCSSINGNPSPQYAWYRNGTRLTYDNDYFSFSFPSDSQF